MPERNSSKVWKIVSAWILVLLYLTFTGTVFAGDLELNKVKSAIRERRARWVAGETSVSKLPEEEKLRRVGLIKPEIVEISRLKAIPDYAGLDAVALPAVFDWRKQGANNFVTPVRNQGNCGSCWAFATTGALESNALISESRPGLDLNLSEQVLVSCSLAGDCDGGRVSAASDYIQNNGLPAESCFSYAASNLACNACATYLTATSRILDWHWVAIGNVPSVETLKAELYTYGPLVTTMSVYGDFYTYKAGIYSYTTGSLKGYHAVLLVGYDDLNRCFIVKNSWGTGWGEGGYFRIAYTQMANLVEFGSYTIAYEGLHTPTPQPCSYSISTSAATHPSIRSYGTITVTADAGCSWSASSNVDWIRIRSARTGVGSGAVSYCVSTNRTPEQRTGTIAVAGQTFTVTQSGRIATPTR